jgi:glycosyltransferase involved in cell wall biosynthesis
MSQLLISIMESKPRLLRITTVPISLKLLLSGQLSFFQQQGFEVLAVSANGDEISALTEGGIPHKIVPMTRVISPLQDIISLLKLIGVIKKFRPQIVHTHTPKAGLLGMMAAWICGVPVRLHTVAGLPLMERSGLVKALLIVTEKITYRCATRVYSNSQGLKNFIELHIRPSTPLKIIGNGSTNGINIPFFSPTEALHEEAMKLRERFGIDKQTIQFAFIGRVVRDKGVNELLLAFNSLSQRINAKLLLAGTFEDDLDPISEESRKIISENANIIALGHINDVRPLLLASDVFVFPSYREGFPNVVLQAGCMGCACIVSDINGCNEIINHEKTGLIVKSKNATALESAMLRLGTNASLRKTLSENARAYVAGHFDQKFIWQELLNEYLCLLEASKITTRKKE